MLHFLDKILSHRFPKKKQERRRRDWREERMTDAAAFHRSPIQAVPRRELAVALAVGVNMITLPWIYGGQDLWGQSVSMFLSAFAFAMLFLPVGYDEWRSATPRQMLHAVLRCPPFWAGLALVILMALQGLNPRCEMIFDKSNWQLPAKREWVHWLPTGIEAPIWIKPQTPGSPGGMNAFREILIFAPMWLTFTALWCGVKSRRVVMWTVRVLIMICVGLAIFAIGARAAHETLVYGKIPVSVGSPLGPFLYQNQGGAFFVLASLLALAMAIREWRLSGGDTLRGGSYFVFFAAAALLAAAAVFSSSASAISSVAVILTLLVPTLILARPKSSREGASSRAWLGWGVVILLIVMLVCSAVFISDIEAVRQKILSKWGLLQAEKLDDRSLIRDAAWMMYADANPFFGVGAGGFRWLATEYFARIPQFRVGNQTLLVGWYAHCDWLQMLVEWGLFGAACVAGIIGWVMTKLTQFRVWKSPSTWPLICGVVLLCAHACVDFLLYLPALNLLVALVIFVALFWARETKA